MTRAEHASFIKGLESARRIVKKEHAVFLGIDERFICRWIADRLTDRIRRERKKARAKCG